MTSTKARNGALADGDTEKSESSSAGTDQAARRERREQRRALQRAQNKIRSAEMHVARRVHEGAGAMPVKPPLRNVARPAVTSYAYVGCSGWYYRHWANEFYPPGLPSARWFDHYANQFNTVELNAPFYSWPTLKTVANWKRHAAQRNFIYTIKVNELITHIKRFSRTDTLVKDFGLIAGLLEGYFGCFLFQLPPSFRYSRPALERIMRQLDPRLRNVVEFRHRSWWNEKVFRTFRENGTIFCSTSGPRLPDELVKTAEEIYIRFHGTQKGYRHNYTASELSVWVERVLASDASRVWAYFNNDREGYAIKNAREFRGQLVGRCPADSVVAMRDDQTGAVNATPYVRNGAR